MDEFVINWHWAFWTKIIGSGWIWTWELCQASKHPTVGLKSYSELLLEGCQGCFITGVFSTGIWGFRKENRNSPYITISTLRFENLTTVLYCWPTPQFGHCASLNYSLWLPLKYLLENPVVNKTDGCKHEKVFDSFFLDFRKYFIKFTM